MNALLFIVVIATSIWVLVDAKTIGVKKGQIKGLGDIGPWGWFFVCLGLWIVGFPFYLAKRSEFKRINSNQNTPSIKHERNIEAYRDSRNTHLYQKEAELYERPRGPLSHDKTDTFVTKRGRVFTRSNKLS